MDMSLSKLQEIVKDREAWHTAVWGLKESDIIEQLNNNKTRKISTQGPRCTSVKFYEPLSSLQLCLTLCNPMDCSPPGFAVLHHLRDFAQTHVQSVGDVYPTISSAVIPFSSWLQPFPAPGSFPMCQLFTSSDQSIGASVAATVLPMNIQGWFPLGLTGLISLLSKRLSFLLELSSL